MTPRRRGLTIGAVLAHLQGDFPDLTISKIRFLETEGLVTPERTPAGYRLFREADVERLRYVLTAQRDRFWPLRVIREALDAIDRGLTPVDDPIDARPVVPPSEPDADVPSPAELGAAPALRLTEAELLSAAGVDAAFLSSLRTFGLVRPAPDGHFDEAALAVARAAAGLASYGVEARHLRMFRTAADREVGLVQQITGPLLAAQGKRGGGVDPTPDLLHHCLALHAALVKAELRA